MTRFYVHCLECGKFDTDCITCTCSVYLDPDGRRRNPARWVRADENMGKHFGNRRLLNVVDLNPKDQENFLAALALRETMDLDP